MTTLSVAILPAQIAGAATVSVTNCNDSGSGSLRSAVANAASGDTITFFVSCPPASPIILTSGVIDITTNLTISGPGQNELAVSGNDASEVFAVAPGVTATISGLTIEDGSAANGGGIENDGTLTVTNSTISGNTATCSTSACETTGGGILNNGVLTVTNSTVSDNKANTGSGCTTKCFAFSGGIQNNGTLTVTASTLSDNSTNSSGCTVVCGTDGGAILSFGPLIVTNSTISGNSTNPSNCVVVCISAGGGLESDHTLTLTNSTLSGNSANNSGTCTIDCVTFGVGGGIYQGGTASVGATIVANSATTGGDCAGNPFTDLGNNLDDDGTCGFTATSDYSAQPSGLDLAGLQNNGGPTETIALEPGSVAIDHVTAALCPPTDQRGFPRQAPCDIGAYDTDGSALNGSQVRTVVQVETSASYAGDTVDISSSQLQGSCGGSITFETLQNGGVGNPTVDSNSIPVVLDDDGNATVVVEGSNCAPGTYLIDASMAVAPYLTALTTLVVNPPVVSPEGVTGSPANEVETGNSLQSGASDVYAVFDVETNPVYAEQTVEISAPELESRCGLGWRWEPGNGGIEVDGPSTTTAGASTTLDDDGNAVFVFEGASCAAGASTVTADVEAGTHPTYTTTYTIVAPQATLTATTKATAVKRHRHHRGPTGSTPPPTPPAMTVSASPNPLVETGS